MKKLFVYILLLLLIPRGFSGGSIFDIDGRIKKAESFKIDYAIGLFGGLNFSTYSFQNSSGEYDRNYDYIRGSNYGLSLIIAKGYHQFRPELSFHKGGARYIYNNTPITWETSYLSAHFAYMFNVVRSRYDFTGRGNAAPYSIRIGLAVGFNYLASGIQTIGQKEVSLTGTNAISRFDVNISPLATFGIRLTNLLAFNIEYRFNYGMLQIERNSPTQKTHNLYHSLLVAIYHKLD